MLPIVAVTVSSMLLSLALQMSPPFGWQATVFRVASIVVLGGACAWYGMQQGKLRAEARYRSLLRRSEAEVGVLKVAVRLAGGLARADMVGWGGRLTRDEKDLIDAVAELGRYGKAQGLL